MQLILLLELLSALTLKNLMMMRQRAKIMHLFEKGQEIVVAMLGLEKKVEHFDSN